MDRRAYKEPAQTNTETDSKSRETPPILHTVRGSVYALGATAAAFAGFVAGCAPGEEGEGPAPTNTETSAPIETTSPDSSAEPSQEASSDTEPSREGIGVFPEKVEALEELIDPTVFEIPAGDYSADELAELVIDRENTWSNYFMTPETYDDFVSYVDSADEDYSNWSFEDFGATRAKAVKNKVVGSLVSEDYIITEDGGNVVKETTDSAANNLALYIAMYNSEENNGVEYKQETKVVPDTPQILEGQDGMVHLSLSTEFINNLPELPAYSGESNGYQRMRMEYTLKTEGDTIKIISRDGQVVAE